MWRSLNSGDKERSDGKSPNVGIEHLVNLRCRTTEDFWEMGSLFFELLPVSVFSVKGVIATLTPPHPGKTSVYYCLFVHNKSRERLRFDSCGVISYLASVHVCLHWFLLMMSVRPVCFSTNVFVLQANNRSLSLLTLLGGEDEEEGTELQPLFTRSAKNHSSGVQSRLFLGNPVPWIACQEGHFRSKAGNAKEMYPEFLIHVAEGVLPGGFLVRSMRLWAAQFSHKGSVM